MENNDENIKKEIVDIFTEKGFMHVRLECEDLLNRGDGTIGILLNAKISGFKDNVLHKFDTVVKIAPSTNEGFRKVIPLHNLFNRENLFYTKIAPIYEALQDEFELCIPEQMRCVLPKCLASSIEFRKEILVLENLNNKGYTAKMLERLDYDHAALIVRSIGKLHALSFIYKDRYPKRFDELTDHFIKNSLLNPYEEFCETGLRKHAEYSFKQFTEAIIDEELRKRCLKVFDDNLIPVFKKLWRPSKVNVILHGDVWNNNFMFQYKNDKPVKVVPFDFQWSTYASIAYDCMYLLGSPNAYEIRNKYFKEIINEYYASFKDFLSLCGYEADTFCTYDEFWAEVKKMSLLSICVSAFTLPFVEFPSVPIHKLLENAPVVYSKTTDLYRTIVNDLMKDWSEYGFI